MPKGFLSGKELRALATKVREQEVESAGRAGSELMPQVVEQSSWDSHAIHMRIMCLCLDHHGRDFLLDVRDLINPHGISIHVHGDKTWTPSQGLGSIQGYVFGFGLTHEALGLGYLPTIKKSLPFSVAYDGYKKASDRTLPPN